MNTNAVNVAVVDGKTITESVELRTTKQGEPVRIKAVKDGKYILAEGGENPVAPENLTIKRVGNDLHVATEGTDPNQPQLIIEGFYESSGQLVGIAEDGAYYEYISSDAEQDHAAAFLSDGVSSPQVLGAQELVGFGNGLVAGGGIGWFWPALLGLGALGLLGAAYALTRDDDNKHDDAAIIPGIPSTPGIGGATDNVGAVQGPINKGDSTDDRTPTFTGVGTPGNTIIIEDNGKPIGEVIVGEDGKWEFTPTTPLPEGEHSIIVVEKDKDGNVSQPSDEFDFIVDITAPGKSVINSIVDDFGDQQGVVASNGHTDDNTPTLSGTAEAGAKLEIFANGEKIGETTVNPDGTWSYTPSPALTDGEYSFTTVATDVAGNVGLPSDPYIITIDTVAPVKPGPGTGGIEEAIDNVGPIQGNIENGDVTDDTTPTFGGGGLNPGDKVTIIDDGVIIGEVIVGEDGRWEFTPDPALAEGPHPITVIVTDPAGNASEPSDPYIVIVDTTAPVKPGPGTGGIEEAIDNVGPIQGNIENGDVTDDTTPTFGGGGLNPGDKVTIIDDGVIIGEVIVGEDGRWEFTPDPALAEGPHPITVIVTDPAGNASEPSDPYIVIVDTTAPVKPGPGTGGIEEAIDNVGPIQGNIENGDVTDDATPTFGGGGLNPGDKVTIIDDGVIIDEVIVGEDGRWEFTPNPALAEGPHPITVIVTDPAGNASEPSDPYIVIVDTTAPERPTIDSVFDDQGTSTGNLMPGDITDDAQPDISGSAEPGSTVIIYDNGREIGRETVGPEGLWTHTPVPPLLNGNHVLTVEAVDAAGNVSAPTEGFDFELIAGGRPTAPSITGVTDDVPDGIGNIMPGGSTNDTEPEVGGTAAPFSIVNLYANGVLVGTDRADELGNWSITPNPPLAEGLNNLTATATNAAGNESDPTGVYPINVDTTPPVAADGSDLEDNVGPITGSINDGDVTDDNTPTFSGTAEPNTTLIIYDNGIEIDRVPVDGAGNWTFTPAPPLADGAHSFSSVVVDAAGNRSPESTPIGFSVDTSAVAISIEQVFDNEGVNQGPLASGSVTDDTTPTLSGRATPGSTVNVYLDGVLLQEGVPVNARGEWEYSVNPALGDGSYAFSATVVTAASGESAPTADFNLEIDTTASASPTIDQILDDVGDIQDPLADGSTTDDTTPTLVGRGVAGDVVIIRDNGVEIDRVPVLSDGSWSFTPNPPLNDGSHQFDVISQDLAGNQSEPSAPWTIIIDTQAPSRPTIDTVFDDQGDSTGNLDPGDTTDDARPTISGTAESGSTVIIYDNGEEIGRELVDFDGNWTFTPETPLSNGGHELTVEAVDAAGNISERSEPFDFRVDVFRLGSVIGYESFDEIPLDAWAGEEASYDTGLFAITEAIGANASFGHNNEGLGLGTKNNESAVEMANFDLKGKAGNTLTIDYNFPPHDFVPLGGYLEFFDADGTLIHTAELPANHATAYEVLSISMPDGQEFASFKVLGIGAVFIGSMVVSNGPPIYESFDEIPLDAWAGEEASYDTGLFAITEAIGANASFGHNNEGLGLGTKNNESAVEMANFDLKGKAGNTLTIDYNFPPHDFVPLGGYLEFFDADGTLIHTAELPANHATAYEVLSISMPDGQEFASFKVLGIGTVFINSLLVGGDIGDDSTSLDLSQVGDEASNLFLIDDVEVLQNVQTTVHGGGGIDTLALTGADQVLDLTALSDQINSIEVIDLTGTGDNTLNLSLNDVLAQGDTSLFTDDDTVQMMVKGNTGDVVNLDDLMADGTDPGDWAGQGQVTVEGVVYNVFQHSSLDAQLLVQDGVTTNLV
ncbi:Ig-like domain-containing protein [Pseudomonas frederiksbergensis]|uniref:Ig-like domain-containing protein n=1 Tax=Pseudomonas frederiksbergensis TaxID=104087 RepID=UPI003D25A16F